MPMPSSLKRTKPLASGHTVELFEGEVADKYQEQWKGYSRGMVRLQPGGMLLPSIFPQVHDRIMEFKFRSTDVVILSYQKCGTTWMQELLWTMKNNPNLDNPKAEDPVYYRSPFLETDSMFDTDNLSSQETVHPLLQNLLKTCPGANLEDCPFLQIAEHCPDPRIIKTHLPFSLVPGDLIDTAKVVYMARNPKDMIVSLLHHCRLMRNMDYRGTVEEFVDTFIRGDMIYGQFDLHLKEAMALKDHNNLFMVHFEALKADPIKEMKRLNQFLNTRLDDKQIAKIEKYTSFAEMKKRDKKAGKSRDEIGLYNKNVAEADGGFYRKGAVGNWEDKLTPELAADIDSWTKEKLGDSGLNFTYSAKS